jgi:hypothetical protein
MLRLHAGPGAILAACGPQAQASLEGAGGALQDVLPGALHDALHDALLGGPAKLL